MSTVILTDFPVSVTLEDVIAKLKLKENNRFISEVEKLVAAAKSIGRPKIMYKTAYIEDRGDDFIVSEGIRFNSRILSVNLEPAHRFFPYVVTCGRELDEWAKSISDMFSRYCADCISELYMRAAQDYFIRYLEETHHTGKTSAMNPGSLADWPITEQQKLFDLLENPEMIGVTLTPTYLMVPVKTVSGIRFPTATDYHNCMLCPREDCPGRKAPYDPGLFERKYQKN